MKIKRNCLVFGKQPNFKDNTHIKVGVTIAESFISNITIDVDHAKRMFKPAKHSAIEDSRTISTSTNNDHNLIWFSLFRQLNGDILWIAFCRNKRLSLDSSS